MLSRDAQTPPRLLAGLAALAFSAIAAAPAGATGSYPGETLSLSQAGAAVAGQATVLVATGQQTDVDSYAGGFNLEVFEKDPAKDSTCAPSYTDEKNTYANELPAEKYIVVGQWEGLDTPFSVPFKALFDKPGPALLCAYSSWIVDTAAAAQLTVNVTRASLPAAGGKPINVKKPRVTRAGNHLTCGTGTWSNAPTGFRFGWLINGRARKHARTRQLRLGAPLRPHTVQCTVTASNATGTATAISPGYHVQ